MMWYVWMGTIWRESYAYVYHGQNSIYRYIIIPHRCPSTIMVVQAGAGYCIWIVDYFRRLLDNQAFPSVVVISCSCHLFLWYMISQCIRACVTSPRDCMSHTTCLTKRVSQRVILYLSCHGAQVFVLVPIKRTGPNQLPLRTDLITAFWYDIGFGKAFLP